MAQQRQIAILCSGSQSLFSGQLCAKFSMQAPGNGCKMQEWNIVWPFISLPTYLQNAKLKCKRCERAAPQDLVLQERVQKTKLLTPLQVFSSFTFRYSWMPEGRPISHSSYIYCNSFMHFPAFETRLSSPGSDVKSCKNQQKGSNGNFHNSWPGSSSSHLIILDPSQSARSRANSNSKQ